MRRKAFTAAALPPLPAGEAEGEGAARGFSLVELLVVISIVLVMMGLMGAALSNARGNQKKQGTQAVISRLGAILQHQFESYASRDLPDAANPAARAAELRRMVTGDMPDRWADVAHMAANSGQFTSPHQRAYVAVWNSMNPKPSPRYSGAECLFMIVMRGGLADCLDCSDLASGRIGDKDDDGAFEFWDEWDNPIGYILWPAALELPPGSGSRFFSNSLPFLPGAAGETMRPVVYSGGPDGKDPGDTGDFGLRCDAASSNLAAGVNCGNPGSAPASQFATPTADAADNITSLDAEAKQ